MKRLFLTILLALIALTNLEAQGLKFSTRAQAAILYNPDTEAILFQKECQKLHPPASILKIATLLFVLDQKNIDPQKQCLVSKDAVHVIQAALKHADFNAYPTYILEHDGVMAGIKGGRTYSFDTLLHAMLLASGNDAANAVAEVCSESIEKFIEEMNAFLQSKGFHNTRCANPHGLHYPGQATTAYEMARITALALKNPRFAKMFKTASFEGEIPIRNTNRLMREGSKHYYPKFLGGKTGYVASARYNLVAAAEDNGRKLIAVLLGCQGNNDRFEDAIALFETAFREEKKQRLLFSKDHECFVHEVPKAAGPLKGHLDRDVILSYFPSEEPSLKARVHWKNLRLPVAAGVEVGKLIVEDKKGNLLIESPLYSERELKYSLFYRSVTFAKWAGLLTLVLLGLIGLCKFFKKSSKLS